MCINFTNLSRASKKDNYSLQSLDEVQFINGSQTMPFLDGYSRYNQVMREEDRLMTTFTSKQGTFAYTKISFGLFNIGATF